MDDPPLELHSLDCLLFGDILEHLVDPEAVLRRFRRFLAPGGVVLASIPNLQHHTLLAALLSGNFQYAPASLLDATHVRFFTGSEFKNRDIADFLGGRGKLGPAMRGIADFPGGSGKLYQRHLASPIRLGASAPQTAVDPSAFFPDPRSFF